ncbi:MAG: thioredoxin [Johnsonella sp.]|nr:thioredoxin [Johnsonella sp.]
MAALQITSENFENEVLKSDKPVLLDFWAPWCNPCKALLPIIEEIAGEAADFKVGKVNVDEEPSLAMTYKIRTVPSLLVFKNGAQVNSAVGYMPKDSIYDLVRG